MTEVLTEVLTGDHPSALVLAAAIDEPFTLIDIGCSGGLHPAWDVFGSKLRAYGFDPGLHEIERLTAAETRPGVRYVGGFVGLPEGHPAKGAAVDPWRLDPWGRLSAHRTQALQQERAKAQTAGTRTAGADQEDLMARNLWREAALADPTTPIVLPDFLDAEGVREVDFVKIDVDGADFEILQSLQGRLSAPPVLGMVLEVNFFGGPDPAVNSFHNVDRFMRVQAFDLFDLTVRRYSLASLPRPYLYPHPLASQTSAGRPWQGDALYLRDLGYPFAGRDASAWSDDKLLKLATLYAMTGLLDHAAELLILQRQRLKARLDVDDLLDRMTQESQDAEPDLWAQRRFSSYRDYIAAFEADDPAFYSAEERRRAAAAGPDQAWMQSLLAEREQALGETRRALAEAEAKIARLEQFPAKPASAPIGGLAGLWRRGR